MKNYARGLESLQSAQKQRTEEMARECSEDAGKCCVRKALMWLPIMGRRSVERLGTTWNRIAEKERRRLAKWLSTCQE